MLDLEPGQTVAGRFQLTELIGRGAVGAVFRAVDATRGEDVALKVILPLDADGQVSRNKLGRFNREARAMARLRSPHVVEVFDHGACPHPRGDVELVFIAMELLAGESLRDRLKREKKLGPEDTLRTLQHVARAVGLAHQRGIVHRDLKPANIYLCDRADGRPTAKVLDFGMVKSIGMPLATVDHVKTELGRPIGTPYYMSPEQARGQSNVDHRTDLWAMGVIAYECLLGSRPFQGKSLAKVFTEIAAGPLPVPSQHGPVPPGFDAWFKRAVCRDIQQRFQSARVLIDELTEIIGPATTTAMRAVNLTVVTVSDDGDEIAEAFTRELSFSDRTLRRQPQVQGSSFVGREDVVAEMDEAIDNHCRVLTLRAFPGTGKARLAREYGRRRAGLYAGGVWLCSLADVRDADAMWLALAGGLGVHLGEGEPVGRIGRALAGLGHVLVVIENVDGVRAHLAAAVTRWLAAAPGAVFVLTSRRALALPTERVVSLLPLDFPEREAVRGLADTKRWTATQLLLRRAIGYERRLLASDLHAAAVGLVAWHAQGNPLALELLAPCFGGRSPHDLAAALTTLTVNDQGTAIIHQDAVVKSVVRWVVGALPAHEQSALLQLGLFARGFTIPAAEAVVDLSRFPDPPPVDRLVRALATRALLQRGVDLAGERRYTMHPTVLEVCRELGADHPALPAEEREAAELRHGRYFAELGSDESLGALTQSGGFARRARLLSETDNLRIAAERAAARRDGATSASTSLALAAIDTVLGRHSHAAKRLVGPASVAETPRDLRLRCLVAHARALAEDGRREMARRSLERAVEHLDPHAPWERLAWLHASAMIDLGAGRIAEAAGALEAAGQLAGVGDLRGEAETHLWRARLARQRGDLQAARHHYLLARERFERSGAAAGQADAYEELGQSYATMGRPEAAGDAYDRALSLRQELGDRFASARLLGRLGEHALELGDAEAAVAQLQHAVGRCREIGAADLEGRYLGTLGTALSVIGRNDEAKSRLALAEQLLRFEGDHALGELCAVLCRRAALLRRCREDAEAMAAFHEAVALAEELPEPPGPLLARMIASLRHAFVGGV